jgi:hypothetical protein
MARLPSTHTPTTPPLSPENPAAAPKHRCRDPEGNLVELKNTILARLLEDPNVGVRKFAIQSISEKSGPDIRAKLQLMEAQDPVSFVRDQARLKRRELEKKPSLHPMRFNPFTKPYPPTKPDPHY